VRPLSALTAEHVAPLSGVVFDLDDTLLDHGRLTEGAYSALFRLREAGLRLVGATGRPCGWATVLARQWPVDAIISENGAAAVVVGQGGALRPWIAADVGPRAELLAIAERLMARFPEARLTDDNAARVADVTIDIGETCRVPAAIVRTMSEIARSEGVLTIASSVHLHLSHQAPDKAAGAVRILGDAFGEDPTAALRRYAFIGDSGNDATAFAAFKLTFGVANVRASAASLTLMPRFVAPSPMGRGFVEIAAALVGLRATSGSPSHAPRSQSNWAEAKILAPEPRPSLK
jgi:HAD superfamily hydrolase (TIGR01484 family)